MRFLKKVVGTFLALLPIVVIVLFVHFFFYQFETEILVKFLVSVILASIGEAFLLSGIDSTIMPMGELMVQSINKASKLVIFLFFAVAFGTFATIAEPDVAVFCGQAVMNGVSISKTIFVFLIGAGVGLAVALGVIRIIKNIDIKYIYLFIFSLIFLLATQVPSEYMALAFDAGGATTGVITAPFLLAVASGISNKVSKNDNKEVFGMIGVASLGPIISTLLVFILMSKGSASVGTATAENLSIYLSVLKQATLAIVPLTIVFFVYELILIKLPIARKLSILLGLIITFLGLYMFLFSIEFGITEMGSQIGKFIQTLSLPMVCVFCVVIGFVITFSEPSVVVLARQVQNATKGNISNIVVLLSIAVSMAIAILVSVLKIVYNINFFYIVLIGYAVALLLMFFVPSLFTGLAFDSGGVASGPMTSAFLLPIMIQFASANSGALSGFGIIGIVSLSPIIVLQLLGFVYRVELDKKAYTDKKRAIKVSFTADMYSNIIALENEHKILSRKKRNENKKV